jgi:hypothetical protein
MPTMSTKSRQTIYGGRPDHGRENPGRGRAGSAKKAIREADRAEAEAWSIRMEGYGGPAQPSPTIGQCLKGECDQDRALGSSSGQSISASAISRAVMGTVFPAAALAAIESKTPTGFFRQRPAPVDDERRALTHGGSSRTVIII